MMTLLEKAVLAEKAARTAGDMLEHDHAHKVTRKSANDFVTEMDVKSENLIKDILLTACPEDEFFGEEGGGATNCKGRWIVDPIDGTVNYMRHIRSYTISIAYELEGELVVGCVFCPGTNELFLAVKGHGATMNGLPLHVSKTENIHDALLAVGFAHRYPDLRARTLKILPDLICNVSDLRRIGSCAYDLCLVASGRCDGFIEMGLSLYDYAAGYVILKEAGGVFEGWDIHEDPIVTGNLLTTNGKITDALRSIVNP